MGQLPVLEVDGELICQSRAINRYLATEFNLYGENNSDRALIDQVCESCADIGMSLYSIFKNPENNDADAKV